MLFFKHGLGEIPPQVWQIDILKNLDISSNDLAEIPSQVGCLSALKTLKVNNNKLQGLPSEFRTLPKLGIFFAADNRLESGVLAQLPAVVTKLILPRNCIAALGSASHLVKLQVLDLTANGCSCLDGIGSLVGLVDLNLDDNAIETVPAEVASLKRLKILSLRNNRITGHMVEGFQALPKELFTATSLERLNLEGNSIKRRELDAFEGAEAWVERRAKTKQKDAGVYMME